VGTFPLQQIRRRLGGVHREREGERGRESLRSHARWIMSHLCSGGQFHQRHYCNTTDEGTLRFQTIRTMKKMRALTVHEAWE
jgi:hypothetical protein